MRLFTDWHSWPQAEQGLQALLPASALAEVGRAAAFAASAASRAKSGVAIFSTI